MLFIHLNLTKNIYIMAMIIYCFGIHEGQNMDFPQKCKLQWQRLMELPIVNATAKSQSCSLPQSTHTQCIYDCLLAKKAGRQVNGGMHGLNDGEQ